MGDCEGAVGCEENTVSVEEDMTVVGQDLLLGCEGRPMEETLGTQGPYLTRFDNYLAPL